jgi:hypothetical protein
MTEFPHLGLGAILLVVPVVCFLVAFVAFSVISGSIAVSRSKKHPVPHLAISLTISFLAALCTVIVLCWQIGPYAISEIHRKVNQHMPKPSECIYYYTDGYELQADYRVTEDTMKAWVKQYSLRELSFNEKRALRSRRYLDEPTPNERLAYHVLSFQVYRSLPRANGSDIKASYNPSTHIVSIRYVAW